jgi:hypothetical protein
MKKCYITVLLLFLATHLQALEFSNTISVGEMGMSSNFSSWAIYGHLFNFTMQAENGFGIQIVPIRALLDTQTIGFTAVTFFNAMLYYDFFKTKEEILLGQFASINAVNVLKIDSVEYNAGLLFCLRTLAYEFGKYTMASSDWLTVRTGYKYLDGKSDFYVQIGFDLLTSVSVIATFQGEQNKELNKGY